MKSSINFLPAEKRRDLHQLVEIIRNEIKDCVMIILYGSYARDMYVDCDRRRDYGVTTFFMSDYDILIVTRRRLGLKDAAEGAFLAVCMFSFCIMDKFIGAISSVLRIK